MYSSSFVSILNTFFSETVPYMYTFKLYSRALRVTFMAGSYIFMYCGAAVLACNSINAISGYLQVLSGTADTLFSCTDSSLC